MKIDASSGSFLFASGKIGPQYDTTAFLALPFETPPEPASGGPGWQNFTFEPESGVSAAAYFYDGRLQRFTFSLALPQEVMTPWGSNREPERKALHEELLRRELGRPPYFYSWGEIFMTDDLWFREQYIDVRYEPPQGIGDRLKRRLRHWMRRLQEID